MIHAPPQDLPVIYFGLFLIVLLFGMWLPYMGRATYWRIREEREWREMDEKAKSKK